MSEQLDWVLNPTVDRKDVARLSAQCPRLLARLRRGPLTNVEGVIELRILNLTARISELRQAGYEVRAMRGGGGLWTYSIGVS